MEKLMITEKDSNEMKQFREDKFWLEENKDKLKEKHPNQWVAIFNKKILDANPDYNSLIESLKERNVDLGKVVVEYLSTKEEIFVL